jgi:predicted nucleic acid-binding protein
MGRLMAQRSIYLDTNVIIALVEGPEWTGTALQEFLTISRSRPNITFNISSLCFAELLVVPYRTGNKKLAEEYLSVPSRIGRLAVHSVNHVILDTAAVLRAAIARLKLPDAIHLATASTAKCEFLLTFDQDFQNLPQLSHPVFDGAVVAPVKIVRPDPVSLLELSKALR